MIPGMMGILGISCCLSLASCEKKLDLAHKYDNTESSRPLEIVEPEEDPDNLEYTDKGLYKISEGVPCNIPSSAPRADYLLDGKISVFKKKGAAKFTTVWSADYSMWQDGCDTPWMEENVGGLKKDMTFIGKGKSPVQDGFTDGGMWTIGTHQLSEDKYVAFFHAESHYNGVASQYKSIGVAYSEDGGKTWDKGTKIISGPDPKPAVGEGNGKSYGLGDGCVVWNESRKQWICYYSGFCEDPHDFVISMAASSDPEGKPGTWKKWDGSDFTLEACNQDTGLGAKNYCIAELKGFRGGNPSVMWNRKLDKWMMVYHTWGRGIVFSTSTDGIVWSTPEVIVSYLDAPGGAMYPNFISEEGDLTSEDEFRIYYSADMDSAGKRDLVYRKVKIN